MNSEGWRFWRVRPGEDVLRSPYSYTGGIPWPAPFYRAVCTTDPSHVPPEEACYCGIYADLTAADCCARARAYRLAFGGFVTRPGSCFVVVVGRVTLSNAVPFYPPACLPKHGAHELRAASARITELRVVDDPAYGIEEIETLVSGLSSAYDVPVSWEFDGRARLAR